MLYEDNKDLERALGKLTVQEVWRAAGLPNPPRDGNIVVPSPFRDDGSRPSFSIFARGLAWKDHGGDGDGGNVWKFALRVRGGEKKEVADWLIDEVARIHRTPRVREAVRQIVGQAAAAGVAAELPKEVVRAAKKQERAAQVYDAERRLRDQHEAALVQTKTEVRELEKWPAEVRTVFKEGYLHLGEERGRLKEWADGRGWPVAWVEWLHAEGLIAMPWLPWCTAGERWAKRGKALRVEVPRIAADGRSAGLEIVGYHQQFVTVAGDKVSKQWTYVPYAPETKNEDGGDKRLTEFQHALVQIGRTVPSLPWAMGDFVGTKFLCIAEGQWDAITFAGAAGWLWEAGWPAGAAVMGVRGVNGLDTMLAYWGKWLRACAPAVLVLADNDAPGRRWFESRAKEYGQLPEPTFAERLKACGARRVFVSTVRPELGKDFNDYYRARRPGPEMVAKWLGDLEFMDCAGGWK